MLEFKSDVIKDVNSAKMSHLFAAVKVLMKHTFFAFSPSLFLLTASLKRHKWHYQVHDVKFQSLE